MIQEYHNTYIEKPSKHSINMQLKYSKNINLFK